MTDDSKSDMRERLVAVEVVRVWRVRRNKVHDGAQWEIYDGTLMDEHDKTFIESRHLTAQDAQYRANRLNQLEYVDAILATLREPDEVMIEAMRDTWHMMQDGGLTTDYMKMLACWRHALDVAVGQAAIDAVGGK